MKNRALTEGVWLNPPVAEKIEGDSYLVTAAAESDFWRETSYGFIHDSGHALLNEFPQDSAVEVSWILDYHVQFDQGGLIVWSDQTHWVKAGVEYADGIPQLGAVVTSGKSDWSVAPVPTWFGKEVTIRASRSGDALTVRAKCDGDWQLVRLAPLDPEREWKVGLHLASPNHAGLTVRFTSIKTGEPDHTLH